MRDVRERISIRGRRRRVAHMREAKGEEEIYKGGEGGEGRNVHNRRTYGGGNERVRRI